MGSEIGLMATGYALAWLIVLAGFAYLGYRVSQPKQNKIRVNSNESLRNYRPPSDRVNR